MKNYYYYSIIGKTSTGADFMKIVCVENEYKNIRGSNDYFTEAIDYISKRYNVCISSVSVLYGADKKLTNMPNVDYIERS